MTHAELMRWVGIAVMDLKTGVVYRVTACGMNPRPHFVLVPYTFNISPYPSDTIQYPVGVFYEQFVETRIFEVEHHRISVTPAPE